MSDKSSSAGRAERLVAADPGITDPVLKEFRMQLEQSIDTLERKAGSSRRNTIRSLVLLAACYAFGFVMTSMSALGSVPGKVIGGIWVIVTWTVMITTIVVVVRYWCIHRPALERARTDLQIAMFQELQRQLGELARRLDRTEPGAAS